MPCEKSPIQQLLFCQIGFFHGFEEIVNETPTILRLRKQTRASTTQHSLQASRPLLLTETQYSQEESEQQLQNFKTDSASVFKSILLPSHYLAKIVSKNNNILTDT